MTVAVYDFYLCTLLVRRKCDIVTINVLNVDITRILQFEPAFKSHSDRPGKIVGS